MGFESDWSRKTRHRTTETSLDVFTAVSVDLRFMLSLDHRHDIRPDRVEQRRPSRRADCYRSIFLATFQASSNRRFSSTSWAIGMLRNGLLFCDTDLRGRRGLPFRVVPTAARIARHRRFCARLIRLRRAGDILGLFFGCGRRHYRRGQERTFGTRRY